MNIFVRRGWPASSSAIRPKPCKAWVEPCPLVGNGGRTTVKIYRGRRELRGYAWLILAIICRAVATRPERPQQRINITGLTIVPPPSSSPLSIYLQPSNVIAAASAVVALVALGVSLRGCQLAQDANLQTQRQYREERSLILQGDFAEDGKSVKLLSISDSATLLEAKVYFPSEITKRVWTVLPKEKTLYLTTAIFGLQGAIKKRVPSEPGQVKISTDGKIPVLIDAYYASRGEAYQDKSVYLLGVEFVVGEESSTPPAVKFTGLTFLRRLNVEKPVNPKMLDDMMNSKQGIFVPPRTPR